MSIVWLAAVVTAMVFGFCAGRMSLTEGSTEEILPETGAAGVRQDRKGIPLPEMQAERLDRTGGSAEKRGTGKGVSLSEMQTERLDRTGGSAERRGTGKGILPSGRQTDDVLEEACNGYSTMAEARTDAARDRRAGQGVPGRDRRVGRSYQGRGSEGSGALRSREIQSEPRSQAGTVGSPVSGEVEDAGRDGSQTVGIRPDEDRIYAPAGGKILKLFPLGNAFLFRTDLGAELYIQAGDGEDELLGRYYRPRVVRNEIVGKGKLLLEFDREGLEAQGISLRVSITVENSIYGSDITAVAGEYVRTGEEILQIRQPG